MTRRRPEGAGVEGLRRRSLRWHDRILVWNGMVARTEPTASKAQQPGWTRAASGVAERGRAK
jgi:hypothetical protein